MFIDTDQNPRTGFQPILAPGGREFIRNIGVDAVIDFGSLPYDGRVFVNRQRPFEPSYAIPARIESGAVVITVLNEMLGAEFSGDMNFVAAFGDWGDKVDHVPNQGHGTITNSRKISVSPGDSTLVRRLGQDDMVDVVAVVEQDNGASDATLIWLANGENITPIINRAVVTGLLPPIPPGAGASQRSGRTYRFRYPINSMGPEMELTILAVGPDSVAAGTSRFRVISTLEPPPTPLVTQPARP
jgi:hypothetical protein